MTAPAAAAPANRQRRPARERRVEIADAALSIIARRGIAALTLAMLAGELGVTPAALLRHYPSRDAILAAVAARADELIAATLPPPDLPPLERLERLARQRHAAFGSNVGLARLLFSEQFALALPPAAAARLRGLVARNRALILSCLREAARRGEVRSDVRAEELATIVMGTLQALAFFAAGASVGAASVDGDRVWKALLAVLSPHPVRNRRRRSS